jgi:hypothetical protein
VWNLGRKNDATFKAKISLGTYLRTWNFLQLDPNSYGKKVIGYEGGYYVIKDIQKTADGFLLTLTTRADVMNEKGNWDEKIVSGLVAAHFILNDRLWFEIMPGEQTDPAFPRGDFPGRSKEYWRAQKID